MLYTSKNLREKLLMASVAGAFAFTPFAATSVLAQSATESAPTIDRIIEDEASESDTSVSDSLESEDTTVGAGETDAAPESTASESLSGETDSSTSDLSVTEPDASDDTAADGMTVDEDQNLADEGSNLDTGTTAALPDSDSDAMTGIFLPQQAEDQVMANQYIGKAVHNQAGEKLGDINDLVITKDGGIEAAIVGIGGFLGIGQHNVAVDFSQIDIVEDPESGEIELTIAAEREELAEAPAFQTKADRLAEMRSSENSTPAVPGAPLQ